MNRKFLTSTLWCLAFFGTDIAANAQAASSGTKAVKLEHMDYFNARKIILGYGWKPIGGPCVQVNEDTCARFPEIDTCSGVWPAPCIMIFAKENRCLFVGTYGGQPIRDEPGDTHVDSVQFRRGPCSKN
jgi:hypothetical protein